MLSSNIKQKTEQEAIDELACSLNIKIQEMINDSHYRYLDCDYSTYNKQRIILKHYGKQVFLENWAIYFHSARPVFNVESKELQVTHLVGDLHVIEPTEEFKGFDEGKEYVIPLGSTTYSDFMPRAFITAEGTKSREIRSTDRYDINHYPQLLANNKVSASDTNSKLDFLLLTHTQIH